jgi:hypothetical protein
MVVPIAVANLRNRNHHAAVSEHCHNRRNRRIRLYRNYCFYYILPLAAATVHDHHHTLPTPVSTADAFARRRFRLPPVSTATTKFLRLSSQSPQRSFSTITTCYRLYSQPVDAVFYRCRFLSMPFSIDAVFYQRHFLSTPLNFYRHLSFSTDAVFYRRR